jgi:hypothetical protein
MCVFKKFSIILLTICQQKKKIILISIKTRALEEENKKTHSLRHENAILEICSNSFKINYK